MDKYFVYLWILFILSLTSTGITIYTIHTYQIKEINYCSNYERFEMYNKTLSNHDSYILGVAFGNKYYCVWTEDESIEEINNTIRHEECHILIAKTEQLKEHFCGGLKK